MSEDDFPYRDTEAMLLLKDGLQLAAVQRGLSTRGVARELGYKATVVISHMAAGRVPVPLDRALEIAEVVGIDKGSFARAVLAQRHGDLLAAADTGSCKKKALDVASELEAVAGQRLDTLSQPHRRVLREVVADRHPGRRWLSLAELPVALAIREVAPEVRDSGLNPDRILKLRAALEKDTAGEQSGKP